MPNKLLLALDKLIWKMDKLAKVCKVINGKFFCVLTFFFASCTTVSFLGADSLKNMPIIESAIYDTVAANIPEFLDFLSAPMGKFMSAAAFVAILFCHILRNLHRPVALLNVHSTMGHDLSILDNSLKKSFWFKRADIGSQIPPQNPSQEQLIDAIRAQDVASEAIQKKNWCSTVFYYGVAHTPLVFRFGYQWGQTKTIRLLHRFRPTLDAQEFIEMPDVDQDKLSMFSKQETIIRCGSSELLVAIASTYPIIKENIGLIDPSNKMSLYWREVEEATRGVDFFNSYHKIRSYADRFVEDIEKIVRENNIKTVHVILSTSVPFTFYLAQRMCSNQFQKIIVYHYDHTKFTWGIDITEPNAEKAIMWARSVIPK